MVLFVKQTGLALLKALVFLLYFPDVVLHFLIEFSFKLASYGILQGRALRRDVMSLIDGASAGLPLTAARIPFLRTSGGLIRALKVQSPWLAGQVRSGSIHAARTAAMTAFWPLRALLAAAWMLDGLYLRLMHGLASQGERCADKMAAIVSGLPLFALRRFKPILALLLFTAGLPLAARATESPLSLRLSGYVKSFNIFTQTSGLTPEIVDNPLATRQSGVNLFNTLERFRLKLRSALRMNEDHRLQLNADYDHQASFGSFVSTGDFRISKKQSEDRQFLDLSQTLIEDEDGFYEHRLYRLSLTYESPWFDLEAGRQQIPWGKGMFFTPTDVFNPFNPTQVELEERDGTDAVRLKMQPLYGSHLELIYTPPGRVLHPQRYMARIARDVRGYEVGLLGGRIHRDHAAGFDFAGNLKGSAVRGEFLYREAANEDDYIKFTVNADYNFPYNIYGLLEYHHNGQGHRSTAGYERDRAVRGDIQQLAKNYLAVMLGRDLTPLLRAETRAIYNLDDTSFFIRPELQYEIRSNLLALIGAQFFAGGDQDELGSPRNLYFGELKYTF